MQPSPVQYAVNDGVHIAYQVVGDGDRDLVLVQGFMSHLDVEWENPAAAHLLRELASFSRLIRFDKRGTGLSDRNVGVPTLEERMDDVRAVMDAVGSERAVLMGISEGAPMCILFAATYPERTEALVLYGGMARATEAPDYPVGPVGRRLRRSGSAELIMPLVYAGGDIDDAGRRRSTTTRPPRSGSAATGAPAMSPDGIAAADQDVPRHRRAPRAADAAACRRWCCTATAIASSTGAPAEWMAEQIPGARRVELPGQDHFPWAGDADAIVEEVREFLTGARVADEPDRVLATVMFTDVVASTERGGRARRPPLDGRCSMRTTTRPPRARRRSVVARSRRPVTASSRPSTARRAASAARGRSSRRAPICTSTCASACTPARSSCAATTSAGSRCTSASGCRRPRSRRRSSCRARSRTSSPGPASSSRTGASTS